MPTDGRSTPSPDQLDGWKDIAAYLGKSVRAAQRWERDMGLPVHRLKTPGGQVVFARPSEIEAWKARVEVPRDEPGDENGDAVADVFTEPSAGRGRAWAWVPFAAGAVAVAAVVMAALLVWRVVGPGERPVRFQLVGRDLEARDGTGALVWTHRFPVDTEALELSDGRRSNLEAVQVADFDGDGRREVVVVVTVGALSHGEGGVETLVVLAEDGTVLWQYAPDLSLSFGGRHFDGPWVVYDVLFGGTPGDRHIWVAYGDSRWWPGFVVRLDRQGEASVRFVQSGLVYGLGYAVRDGRAYVLAAGVNNEYASAALAVFEADGGPTVSPQSEGSAYRCDGCAGGVPVRYFLLPPIEVTRLSPTAPYNAALSIGQVGSTYEVSTAEWHTSGVQAIYRLSPSFAPESVNYSDSVWTVHRSLEAEGRVDHPAEACPERVEPKIVREWADGAWREVPVPVGLALVPGAKR